jgi:type I restriction enzyme S subunit
MTGLPDGWRSASIGEVASVDSGPAFQSKLFGGPSEGTRLLRGDNIEPGALRWQRTRTWPDERLSGFESLLVEVGDIILAMDRPVITSGLKLGRVTPNDLPALLVQRVARIRTTGVESGYLYHLLESRQFVHHLRGNQVGTQIPHITLKTIREFPVPLPPIHEQRRITDILEDHLSCLDAAEQGLRRSLRRLSSYEAVGLSLCREGIETPLGDVTEIQGGIQKQPKRAPKQNAYPFLRVANVTKNGLDLDEVHLVELFDGELDRLRLKAGDLLVVEGNGSPSQIGRAALWDGSIADCVHQNHLIRVRPKPVLSAPYLEAVWNSPQNRRELTDLASSSSGLHTLSVSKLKSLKVLVPTLDRQRELVAQVQGIRDRRRRLDTELNLAASRTQQLRRSLLAAAFSGRLTGRTTDIEMVEEMAGV